LDLSYFFCANEVKQALNVSLLVAIRPDTF
jgi:hypothetical protein